LNWCRLNGTSSRGALMNDFKPIAHPGYSLYRPCGTAGAAGAAEAAEAAEKWNRAKTISSVAVKLVGHLPCG
jgi:hypothetical protein